jgi:hypothetical protein
MSAARTVVMIAEIWSLFRQSLHQLFACAHDYLGNGHSTIQIEIVAMSHGCNQRLPDAPTKTVRTK